MAPHRLSCQISANQREAETSANLTNIEKHVKARAKGNDVTTNVISANQHFASTFSMQIFKFQRRSCKLSFFFPPNVITSITSSRKGDKKKRKRVQRSPVSCGRDALIKFVEATYRDKSKNRKFLPLCHRNTRLGCVLTKAIITSSLGRPVTGGDECAGTPHHGF